MTEAGKAVKKHRTNNTLLRKEIDQKKKTIQMYELVLAQSQDNLMFSCLHCPHTSESLFSLSQHHHSAHPGKVFD